jgi:hypothetical protein
MTTRLSGLELMWTGHGIAWSRSPQPTLRNPAGRAEAASGCAASALASATTCGGTCGGTEAGACLAAVIDDPALPGDANPTSGTTVSTTHKTATLRRTKPPVSEGHSPADETRGSNTSIIRMEAWPLGPCSVRRLAICGRRPTLLAAYAEDPVLRQAPTLAGLGCGEERALRRSTRLAPETERVIAGQHVRENEREARDAWVVESKGPKLDDSVVARRTGRSLHQARPGECHRNEIDAHTREGCVRSGRRCVHALAPVRARRGEPQA